MLWPFGGFGVVLLSALALAWANAWLGGSPVLAPGESLWSKALVMAAAYAWGLNVVLQRLPGPRTHRWLLVCVSTLPVAGVTGLFIAPAINGLYSWEEPGWEVRRVERVESTTLTRQRERQYWVWIAEDRGAEMPAGRYPLGSYAMRWRPSDGAPAIESVRILHRRGVLGARTVLETMPVQQ